MYDYEDYNFTWNALLYYLMKVADSNMLVHIDIIHNKLLLCSSF